MQYWARVDENDYFQELIDFDPEGNFHESLIWRQVPVNTIEWLTPNIKIVDDNILEADDLEHFRWALKGKISGQRYFTENSHLDITVSSGEHKFWIDRISLLMLSETKRAITSGIITAPIDWKIYDMTFIQLTEEDLDTILSNIVLNKQKAFSAEKACFDIIDNMTTISEFIEADLNAMYQEQLNLL